MAPKGSQTTSLTFHSLPPNMHSLGPSLLSLLSLSLLLHSVAAVDPLFNMCSSSNNYTAGDPFSNNLNQLMFQLATGAPPTGFGLSSVGEGTDKVNGLALCRGDVKSSTCTTCIRTADAQIRQLCPFKKDAIIWFDNCLLHYSDTEFFGEIDNQHKFYLWNTQINVSSPSSEFNGNVLKLMNWLKIKAYLSPLLFATEEMQIGWSEKLYGLAQCTRDLSGGDCNKCLETAIGELPGCCGGKQGGRVVGGSCYVRYELYPFFNA